MLKSVSVNVGLLTWLLVCSWMCAEPIRSQFRKLMSNYTDLTRTFLCELGSNSSPWTKWAPLYKMIIIMIVIMIMIMIKSKNVDSTSPHETSATWGAGKTSYSTPVGARSLEVSRKPAGVKWTLQYRTWGPVILDLRCHPGNHCHSNEQLLVGICHGAKYHHQSSLFGYGWLVFHSVVSGGQYLVEFVLVTYVCRRWFYPHL